MTRKHASGLLTDLRHVCGLMREEHASMDRESLVDIGPHELAGRVLARLDPHKYAPFDVRLCARAALMHMAGALCANVHRTSEETGTTQGILFNAGLQPRYPVEVEGENVGNVLMLRGDWNAALVSELRGFPFGMHDDQIDALSRAFALLIARRPMRISDAALAAV